MPLVGNVIASNLTTKKISIYNIQNYTATVVYDEKKKKNKYIET